MDFLITRANSSSMTGFISVAESDLGGGGAGDIKMMER